MTDLTLYYTSTASTTLSNAGALGTALGGTQGNGTWGTRPTTAVTEEFRKATVANRGAGIPSTPSEYGQLLESTILEGQRIAAGTWTATLYMQYTTATWTGRLTFQVWKRSSAGSYTLIGTGDEGADTALTNSYAARTASFTGAAVDFVAGDKLYLEMYFVCSVRPGTGCSMQWYLSTTATGVSTSQVVTPGYAPTPVNYTRAVTGISCAVQALDVQRPSITGISTAVQALGVTRPITGVSAAISPAATTYTRAVTGVSAAVTMVDGSYFDDFTSDTSASYIAGHTNGGTNSTWAWDTANSRLTCTGGADSCMFYTGTKRWNCYAEAVMDQSAGGGVQVMQQNNGANQNDAYNLYIFDSAASSNTNTYMLYSVAEYTLLASGSISFTRGTPHTIRLEVNRFDLAVYFDGVLMALVESTNRQAAGYAGLLGGGSTVQQYLSFRVHDTDNAPKPAPGNYPTDGHCIYDYNTPSDPDVYKARLDTFAAGGFRVVLEYYLTHDTTAHMIDYINYAASLGMKVIIPLESPYIWSSPAIAANLPIMYAESGNQSTDAGFSAYVINQVKDLPGTWGYYVSDETEVAEKAALQTHIGVILGVDSSKPTLQIQSVYSSSVHLLTDWTSCGSVLGDDVYPYPDVPFPSVENVAYGVGKYCAFNGGIQQAIALQCYSRDSIHNPTYAMMRDWLSSVYAYMQPRIVLWFAYPDLLNSPTPTQLWDDLVAAIASAIRPVTGISASVGATYTHSITGISAAVQALGVERPLSGISDAVQALGIERALSGIATPLLFTGLRTLTDVTVEVIALGLERPLSGVSASIAVAVTTYEVALSGVSGSVAVTSTRDLSGVTASLLPGQSLVYDFFDRGNQSGWGTSPSGDTWDPTTPTGGGWNLSLSGKKGITATTSPANDGVGVRLGTRTAGDCEIWIRGYIGSSANGYNTIGCLLRYQDDLNYTRVGMDHEGSPCTLFYQRWVGGVKTSFSLPNVSTVGLTDTFWMRIQITDGTCYARVWPDGTAEPGTWQINGVSDSTGTPVISGRFGAIAYEEEDAASSWIDHYIFTTPNLHSDIALTGVSAAIGTGSPYGSGTYGSGIYYGIPSRTIRGVTASVQALGVERALDSISASVQALGVERTSSSISGAMQALGVERTSSSISGAMQALGVERAIISILTAIGQGGVECAITGVTASVQALGVVRSLNSISAATIQVGITRPIVSVSSSISVVSTRSLSGVSVATQQFGVERAIEGITSSVAVTNTRSLTTISLALQSLGLERSLTNTSAALKALSVSHSLSGIVSAIGQGGIERTASGISSALMALGVSRTASDVSSAFNAVSVSRAITGISGAVKQIGIERAITSISSPLLQTLTRSISGVSSSVQETLSRSITDVSSSLATRNTRAVTSVSGTMQAFDVQRSLTGILGGIGVAGISRSVTGIHAAICLPVTLIYRQMIVTSPRASSEVISPRGTIEIQEE